VLVAKLSMGALALNDIWFGGQTMNPWLLEEGASGSSAGPGAATARDSSRFDRQRDRRQHRRPSMRCGVTGLRPTFGASRARRDDAVLVARQARPMTRSVEDAMLVLRAISGPDPADAPASRAGSTTTRMRPSKACGRILSGLDEREPCQRCRSQCAGRRRAVGMVPVEVALPDWPYGSLQVILFAEAAAAFEELTLSGQDDQLKVQVRMHGRISSGKRVSCPPSTSSRRIDCGERLRRR
jgi:Asp-tRNA(Asn)/Glu-tRNA(Gln) amidotransferase A subunit family amidase